ncbi:hypothetical protein FVO59_07610 [Microbacterium esteraromaticum]|uniref:Protein-L-isoaspartate carboxylmethyltransferase n=1 Tax=Microbacterium esteraromaticum TaxID=57043 RepID=A0A7D8ALG5_9MICO|nr:hypothetical protein [Microbacterium esteraromaticum]QMU97108.1 hypothetical protein FVO59_07610 [Microbacterium esteraromaticum]
MTFRSKATLEAWLDEFRSAREAGDLIRVIIQDGSDGSDTGLVIVPVKNSSVSIFMQPISIGGEGWSVTLEPNDENTVLDSHQLHALASELAVAAELCSYLEARSVGHQEEPHEEQPESV